MMSLSHIWPCMYHYSLLDSSSGLHLDLVYYRCVCINTTCMEFLYGGLFWLIHHLSYVTELTVDCVIMMGRRLQQSKDGPTNSALMCSFRNLIAQSGLSLRNSGNRFISLDIKANPAHWSNRNFQTQLVLIIRPTVWINYEWIMLKKLCR